MHTNYCQTAKVTKTLSIVGDKLIDLIAFNNSYLPASAFIISQLCFVDLPLCSQYLFATHSLKKEGKPIIITYYVMIAYPLKFSASAMFLYYLKSIISALGYCFLSNWNMELLKFLGTILVILMVVHLLPWRIFICFS